MDAPQDAGKRGVTVKALKRALKKAGLKTTGKKATLTRRAKKARLMGGQISEAVSRASDVAKGVVGVAESAVQAPIKGVQAALNGKKDGKGRSRR